MQRRHNMRADKDRINAQMRRRRMGAEPFDIDDEAIRSCHDCPGTQRDLAWLHARHVVHAVDFLDGPTGHQAIIHHGLAAGAAFFGRLEDHDNRAVEFAGRGEVLGRAEKHGGMAIMAAGMHLPGNGRAVGEVGFLLDRQRVHIGAQADSASAWPVAPVDHADNAGLANPFDHVVTAKSPQLRGNNAGCAMHIIKKLGMRVEITSPAGDFTLERENTRIDGHSEIP